MFKNLVKMNLLLVLCLMVIHFVVADEEQYTDRYDNLNVDEIINNRRLFEGYMKCLLNKGRCTPEGKEIKAHIIDAMHTACKKCTPKQRKAARQVVRYIRDNDKMQHYWNDLKKLYDPDNKYKDTYEPFFASDD